MHMKTFAGTCLALLISLSATPTYAKPYDDARPTPKHHPTANSVPEINVSSVGIVIALMAGAVAIVRETRKRS